MKRVNYKLLNEDRGLNWSIKLMELSIKLQDKSHAIVKEAIRLYEEGVITRNDLMNIVRISGIRLSKNENLRKFEVYDDEIITEENMELVEDYESIVEDNYEEVNEEYVGQRLLKRVLNYD